MKAALEAIVAFLKSIPIIADWLKKAPLDKERQDREAAAKEHEKTAKEGRPSNEFFDERHL
jgi:hypothetical protein